MGRHTAASWLAETGKMKDVCPILAANEGKLPPFIIFFGDRRRVIATAQHLNMRDVVRLDLVSERFFGLDGSGRVNLAFGLYGPEDKPIPLLLAETQMGCPPNQIILRELVPLTSTKGYVVKTATKEKKIGDKSISIVRAGTAGGINFSAPGSVRAAYDDNYFTRVAVGDVVVADKTTGHIGAVLQSLGIMNPFGAGSRKSYIEGLVSLGIYLDNDYPMMRCSPALVTALLNSAKALGLVTHIGTNLSKDSLYAEANEDIFIQFRSRLGVLSTEMEQTLICFEAARYKKEHGIDLQVGLISALVGLVPGGSFASGDDETRAKVAEKSILTAAADALHNIAYPD
jgi:uridine phosphorylase